MCGNEFPLINIKMQCMAVYSQYMLYIGYGRHIPIGLPDTIAIMGKGRGMSILPEESTVQILLSNLISRKLDSF